ncbi:hypothetical protein ACTXLB_02460 [Brachybacterium tyrofermentans]|uniref:hypothetical protein n=1 Tax=Brachybacterium tyrofermentans TaxID=47848 RepID=UPI003FCEF7C9
MARPAPLVEIDGARELRRTLRAAGDDLEDLKAANQAAANIAAAAARTKAPKLTGRLAGDIRASGTKTAGIIRAGRKKIPYAGPIHWGWPSKGIAGRPYITQGAQQTESIWVPLYQKQLDQALKKVKGK